MRRFLSTRTPFRAAASPPTAGAHAGKPKPPKSIYADSLILPKSSFPTLPPQDPEDKKRLLRKSSEEVYKWQESNLPENSTFVLHDGPPYANGDLHMGHALNKFLKDLVLRTHILRSRRVSYIPGWDCHGLPIELKALKSAADAKASNSPPQENTPIAGSPIRKVAKGISNWKPVEEREVELSPLEVRKLARELAGETVESQELGFRKWGIMGDWGRKWRTMDMDYELRQMEVFAEMVEKGLIYRRYKPIYWSPSSGSALAEAELEYNEKHKSISAFIKFPITSLGKYTPELTQKLSAAIDGFDPTTTKLSALVWTTTPWTIPANRALALNSSMEYAVVDVPGHGLCIVAVDRIKGLEKDMRATVKDGNLVPLATMFGFELEGAKFVNPLLGEHAVEQPVLFGDFVTAESGTGVVHCAPGHGMEDYLLCQKMGIEPFSPVDDNGKYTADVLPFEVPVQDRIQIGENVSELPSEDEDAFLPILEGLDVLGPGNKIVLKMLKKNKALVEMMPYVHKYPYDWRTKKPVLVRSTAQWFANVGDIKEAATESLKDIEFIPDSGKTRLNNYVEARNEWCISRQRAWGVPIPVLYDAETGEPLLTAENVRFINKRIQQGQLGSKHPGWDAWFDDSVPNEMFIADPALRERKWVRGKETMDVWFDSGSSWATLMSRIRAQETPAADLYLEGSDQHRGWFQSSLLTSIAATGAAPYRSVLTHGFVLDHQGRKMSKSIGNVIAPEDILSGQSSTFGSLGNTGTPKPRSPDLLRLWAASTVYTKDVQVGGKVLSTVSGTHRKFRTTVRYLISNLTTWDGTTVPYEERTSIDRYLLHELAALHKELRTASDSYAFYKAIAALTNFTNVTLSSFYFVIMRDPLYAEAPDALVRRSALATMFDIFTVYLPALTLYTPILAEEVMEHLTPTLKTQLALHAQSISEHAPSVSDFSIAAHLPARQEVPAEWTNEQLASDFMVIRQLDDNIKLMLEEARKDGHLKVSLEATAILLPRKPPLYSLLAPHAPSLASIFNLSTFTLASGVYEFEELIKLRPGEGEWVFESEVELVVGKMKEKARLVVRRAGGEKCPRCWNFTREVESDVCGRCRGVLSRTGWRVGMRMGEGLE